MADDKTDQDVDPGFDDLEGSSETEHPLTNFRGSLEVIEVGATMIGSEEHGGEDLGTAGVTEGKVEVYLPDDEDNTNITSGDAGTMVEDVGIHFLVTETE